MDAFDRPFSLLPPGSWWIRWIDGVVINAGQRTVTVLLEPWPDPTIRGAAIRTAKGASHAWIISASNLGLFAVGDVFHDGRIAKSDLNADRVRSVCDRIVGWDSTRSFTVTLSDGDLGDKAVHEDYPGPRLRSWSSDVRPRLLSKTAYPNEIASDGRCRLLRAAEGHVIVPASEMLRAFVAPHVRILRALFSAPLEEAVRSLVLHPPLAPLVPGRFRVDLLPGVPHEMAPYIANLLKAHNPEGFREASRLWGCLDPPPSARHPTRLPALMPFHEGTLRFSAKCFEIFPGFFLAGRVTSFDWPDPRPIESSHPAGLAGNASMVPAGAPRLQALPNALFDPATDPGPTADETQLAVEMPTVGRQPNLTPVTRPRGDYGATVTIGADRHAVDRTATGTTDPYSDAAGAVVVPREVPGDRRDAIDIAPDSRSTGFSSSSVNSSRR